MDDVMDKPSRDQMDAAIRAFLQWCENEGEEVPESLYAGVDDFLDDIE